MAQFGEDSIKGIDNLKLIIQNATLKRVQIILSQIQLVRPYGKYIHSSEKY